MKLEAGIKSRRNENENRNAAILFPILESRKPRKYNTRVLLYPVTAHRTRCDDDARGLPSYGSQPVKPTSNLTRNDALSSPQAL